MFMTKLFKTENKLAADRNEIAVGLADGFVDVSVLKNNIYLPQKQD